MDVGPVKIPVLIVLAVTVVLSAIASASPRIEIYFTATAENGVPLAQPSTEFDCTDTVYAVIDLKGLSPSEHRLDVVWRDPRGKEREHNRHEFRAPGGEQRLWIWLRMHKPAGAGFLQAFNPSAGMDDFVGDWTVKFAVDGRLLDTKHFAVIC